MVASICSQEAWRGFENRELTYSFCSDNRFLQRPAKETRVTELRHLRYFVAVTEAVRSACSALRAIFRLIA